MNLRLRLVAIAATSVVALGATAAAASASQSNPSTAPTAVVGTQYFGNTDHCSVGEPYTKCHADLWKLPALLAGDRVTVAWSPTNTSGPRMCITGNVDDYSWVQNRCNRSTWNGTSSTGLYSTLGGSRDVATVPAAASTAFLTFYDGDCFGACGDYGPYEFTVEKIQHRVLISLPAQTTVVRNGTIKATARTTNGKAIAGKTLKLTVNWGTGAVTRSATTNSSGVAAFALGLGSSLSGKTAKFKVTSGSSTKYLAGVSTSFSAKLVDPPVKATVTAPGGDYFRIDVNPDKGAGYWSFTLQKRNSSGAWASLSTIYQTQGATETRQINLSKGTYRAVVLAKYGYRATVTSSVTLVK